jgi:hypothetical protein
VKGETCQSCTEPACCDEVTEDLGTDDQQKIMPVVTSVALKELMIFSFVNFRLTRAMRKAQNTPIAAASVALKIPV